MSLLKRLGRTKEQAIKEVGSRGEQAQSERGQETNGRSSFSALQQQQEEQNTYSSMPDVSHFAQQQMASSFAGRRSAIVQVDQMQELRMAIHRRLVDEITVAEQQLISQGKEAQEQIKNLIASYVEREMASNTYSLSRAERMVLVDDICDELLGLGPLEPLLKDASITEIMVNGPQDVFVERAGKLLLSDTHFYDETHLMNIIERILAPLGRRVDESSPLVDARLADGSRVNIIIPPLSLVGPVMTIRKFSQRALSVESLMEFGTMNEAMAVFLEGCVRARLNILVSGGTGSGKTTTLNVLSSFIPSTERIVTIEDAAELHLQQRHVVTLEARPANIEGTGAVTIRDLVRNALRMRPDRIIVGEVRSGEALDMLQAMNTGHDGSLTTAHANSPRDVLSRLETMTLMAGMELPVRAVRTQISSAINIIIHQSRIMDGSRKITHITEVQGMEGDTIILQDLFRYVQDYINEDGKSVGHFESTGLQPSFMEKFRINGVNLPRDIFSNSYGKEG
ncbi:CpaF family protein [Selenomonas ruminantium]|uniref:Pilus assembly protein CpaF n=1 Tax=Selenomonas ruminantium TaxID=971 RepID=A0A1H0TRQ8_SELRU|nr:pilus assembly protein CpaF [Selenomonas ruminantium]